MLGPLRAALRVGALLVVLGLVASASAQSVGTTIQIDAGASRRPIDPRIYGVAYASPAQVADLRVPLNRYGGNNTSRYNWELNADNRGSDWYFQSIGEDDPTPGARGDAFIRDTRDNGGSPMITVPTIGWVAKLGPNREKLASFPIRKYGPQTGRDSEHFPDAGNGINAATGKPITGNDPNDANRPNSVAFQQGWVNHLVQRWGRAADGGLRYYILDNEPSLWHHTHRDVHPNGATMDEVRDYMVDYATMIKNVDPTALVVGPEEWGWSGYFYSGYDQKWGSENGWGSLPDRNAHGGAEYLPWLLDQLRQREATTGKRLLDVFTVHFYPQGGEFGGGVEPALQLRRNRSTRALWDPSYVDETWIGTQVRLIPRLREWVDRFYPGTQIGLTEYSWGAEWHINGATAQADIWGIFGREGLEVANRWATPDTASPTYAAMKLYRNYDGAGSGFGDISVLANAPNPDNVASFAAERTSDGALTVMLINKQLSETESVTLNLSRFNASGTAQRWQVTAPPANQAAGISRLSDVSFPGTTLTTSLPPQSITLLVLPRGSATPNPTFTSTVSVAPATVALGQSVTATVNLTSTSGAVSGGVVDLEIYDAAGVLAGQKAWSPESFTEGQQRSFTHTWTPAAAGQYTLKVGVFGADWTPLYHWNDNAATLTVTSGDTGGGTGTGLRGEYFTNASLQGSPAVTRTDATVDFGWEQGSPAPTLPADNFSVRWSGQVEAPVSGSYTFSTVSDDGIRLWVNGQLVIDNWTDHAPTENTSPSLALAAAQKYDVRLEFYERGGGATARLLWSYPGQAKQVIPQQRLYPANGGGGGTPPNSPPSVSLTSPAEGASFTAPATVELAANAGDSDGTVAKVEFFQGATKLGEDTTSPYTFTWAGVGEGSYTLTARATDNAGASTTSTAVSIRVEKAANRPPTVTLTSPAADSTYTAPASIQIEASASDPDGSVQRVEFFNGETRLGESTSSPYSFVWDAVPAGSYSLSAKVTDDQGAADTSSVVRVTVLPPSGGGGGEGTGAGLRGEYFTNTALQGSPALTRTDATVEFGWGDGAPGAGLPRDYFSVRWSGQVEAPVSGSYTFSTVSDDGIRLWVGGQLVINNWSDHAPTEDTSPSLTLASGQKYDVRLDYYEKGGGATARLLWSYPGQAKQVVPQIRLYPANGGGGGGTSPNSPPSVSLTGPASGATFTAPATVELAANAGDSDGTVAKVEFFQGDTKLGEDTTSPYTFTWQNVPAGQYTVSARATDNSGSSTASVGVPISVFSPNPAGEGTGTGLRGEYFTNTSLQGPPALTRTDATVEFGWGDGAPGAGLPRDYFSVRWSGQVEAPVSGSYTFSTVSDDGIRLWVNGQLVIDNWTDHAPTENASPAVTLAAGQRYVLKLEYYEKGGGATVRLLWSYPGQAKQAIPQIRLYPGN